MRTRRVNFLDSKTLEHVTSYENSMSKSFAFQAPHARAKPKHAGQFAFQKNVHLGGLAPGDDREMTWAICGCIQSLYKVYGLVPTRAGTASSTVTLSVLNKPYDAPQFLLASVTSFTFQLFDLIQFDFTWFSLCKMRSDWLSGLA